MNQIVDRMKRILRTFQNMRTKKKISIIAVLIGILAVVALLPGKPVEEVVINETPEVRIINVAEASTESSPLSVTGTVRSETEAQLRTETQGEVIGVYTTVGSFVSAGTVLAELRNNSERAAVSQAQAGLEAAEANLAKATGGVRTEERTILEVSVQNAENTLEAAETSARTTLEGGYSVIDDAINAKTDALFSNPESANPSFSLATSESQTVSLIVQTRIQINQILDRHIALQGQVLDGAEALIVEIETLQNEFSLIQDYLDSLLVAINNAIPTPSVSEVTIATFKAETTAARSAVNASFSSFTNAITALNNAATALEIAKQNLEQGLTGAQAEDVVALEAAVRQAEAGLSAARANLARTLIVTPISGTVNTLGLRRGDFVSAFTPAATVSNNNALEIVTFVTDDDKTNIRLGTKVLIDGQYEGVVTSIAPGLDPITKRIEVRVGVVDTETTLTNGSSVRIAIDRNGFDIELADIEEITIPISALKIETNRVIVFSVDENAMLVPHEVSTGLVLGDNIVITRGLTPDMNIVKDARGLREGQEVVLVTAS